jgi:hypothetical protein
VQVQVTDGVNTSPTESGNLFIPPANEGYAYDEDGNLKADGRWSYTGDAENRLTKMESVANPPSGSARRLEFKYDWCGRRIYKKETDLGTSQVISEHIYVYDGWNLYAELTASGTLVQTYIWGQDLSGSREGAGGVGGLVGVEPAGGAVHFAAYARANKKAKQSGQPGRGGFAAASLFGAGGDPRRAALLVADGCI